jgi:hypothetical protein
MLRPLMWHKVPVSRAEVVASLVVVGLFVLAVVVMALIARGV